MPTKQERKSLGIAKRLVKALSDIEKYDGDPEDVLSDASINANRLPEVQRLIEALRAYYSEPTSTEKGAQGGNSRSSN